MWYDLPVDSVTIDGSDVNGMYDLSQLEKQRPLCNVSACQQWGDSPPKQRRTRGQHPCDQGFLCQLLCSVLTQSYSKVGVGRSALDAKGLGRLIHSEKIEEILCFIASKTRQRQQFPAPSLLNSVKGNTSGFAGGISFWELLCFLDIKA